MRLNPIKYFIVILEAVSKKKKKKEVIKLPLTVESIEV